MNTAAQENMPTMVASSGAIIVPAEDLTAAPCPAATAPALNDAEAETGTAILAD